jgi:hypothetical protein
VQPLEKLVAIAVITIASTAGAHAQTAAPATAIPGGTAQGPWTSVKPGNSGSYCGPGEYAAGFEVEVAPSGTGPVLNAFPDFALSAGVTGSDPSGRFVEGGHSVTSQPA